MHASSIGICNIKLSYTDSRRSVFSDFSDLRLRSLSFICEPLNWRCSGLSLKPTTLQALCDVLDHMTFLPCSCTLSCTYCWVLSECCCASFYQFPEVVPLNIGGMHFTTRLSTLRRYEDTMLSAMFSGRHYIPTDAEGRYFIDRDGAFFGYVSASLPTKHSWAR